MRFRKSVVVAIAIGSIFMVWILGLTIVLFHESVIVMEISTDTPATSTTTMMGTSRWSSLSEQSQSTSHTNTQGQAPATNSRHATEALLQSSNRSSVKTVRQQPKNSSLSVASGKQRQRRTKAHFCPWKYHNKKPIELLKAMGYEQVDAFAGDDFDIVFGGYIHCHNHQALSNFPGEDGHQGSQDYSNFDWNMEWGLNKQLLERGFDKFQPHQVWNPCMGCRDAGGTGNEGGGFCNKRELCKMQRRLQPNSCFVLPQDRDILEQAMVSSSSSSATMWVIKRDKPGMHAHLGRSVAFIGNNVSELPAPEETIKDESYLVQEFREPWLGEGNYHRKAEIRVPLAITSTSPFRAYIYADSWVLLAKELYQNSSNNNNNNNKRCNLLNNAHSDIQCNATVGNTELNTLLFRSYAVKAGVPVPKRGRFWAHTRWLLRQIMKLGRAKMASHVVNAGLTKAGAACISYMRADIEMDSEGNPTIFEINEFPSSESSGFAYKIITQAYNDLFRMVGLDDIPVPANERRDFEEDHLGRWIKLYDEEEEGAAEERNSTRPIQISLR